MGRGWAGGERWGQWGEAGLTGRGGVDGERLG